jgi:hypothetical protein
MAYFKAVVHQISNNSISCLNLSQQELSAQQCTLLAYALKTNSSLLQFSFANNRNSGIDGLSAIANALADHNYLVDLDFSANYLESEGTLQ